MTETVDTARGWWWPSNSRKAHFIMVGHRSLCDKWAYWGTGEQFAEPGVFGEAPGPDDCTPCWRKAKAAEESP